MIAGLILLALEPTGGRSWFEVNAGTGVSVNGSTVVDDVGEARWSAVDGSGTAGVSVFYAKPIIDDEAPLILAQFLQRVPALQIAGNVDHFAGSWRRAGTTTEHRTGGGSAAGVSADAYFGSFAYAAAAFGISMSRWRDDYPQQLDPPTSTSLVTLPFSASFGLRLDNTLYWAGWSATPFSDDGAAFKIDFWGGVSAGLSTVFGDRAQLDLSGSVVRSGAFGRGFLEYFVSRALGCWFEGDVGHVGAGEGETSEQSDFSMELGAGWWVTPQLELAASFAPELVKYTPPRDLLRQTFSLSVRYRPHQSPRPAPVAAP